MCLGLDESDIVQCLSSGVIDVATMNMHQLV